MHKLEGAWELVGWEGDFKSDNCQITFLSQNRVVFEELFPKMGWSRFWFYYEIRPHHNQMILWPINQGLKNIYNGRNRIINFMLTENIFRILHDSGGHSDYKRFEREEPPAPDDKFPKTKK